MVVASHVEDTNNKLWEMKVSDTKTRKIHAENNHCPGREWRLLTQ